MTTPLRNPGSYHLKTLSESRPLARTPHRCTVCGQLIPAGLRYQRIVVRDFEAIDQSRSVSTYKWHLPSCPQGRLL